MGDRDGWSRWVVMMGGRDGEIIGLNTSKFYNSFITGNILLL